MKSIDQLRRRFLSSLGLGLGASALAATAQAASTAAAAKSGKIELTFDVAILGHTNYDNEEGAVNRHPDYANQNKERFREGYMQSDLRGSTFYHEGLIYAGGTFPEPKTEREVNWSFATPPLGTFFDRGWVVINNKSDGAYVPRPNPHLLSHTDYYLGGVVSDANLTPTDMIAVVGLQHDNSGKGVFTRAVVGGTGRFAGVRGQMIQTAAGHNSSQLRGRFLPPGMTVPSPNFRVKFELFV